MTKKARGKTEKLKALGELLVTPDGPSRRCTTCEFKEESPEFAEALARVVASIKSGKFKTSHVRIHAFMQREYKYPVSVSSWRAHINKCEGLR